VSWKLVCTSCGTDYTAHGQDWLKIPEPRCSLCDAARRHSDVILLISREVKPPRELVRKKAVS
jgi:hypothetical protein